MTRSARSSGGGGYAEYCVAPQSQCLRPPATLSLVEAAAVPETFFTVWTNVFERGRLQRKETILIHGGSSGIGTTAIQLARAFGAQVFTTVGSERKGDACMALGADLALNYRTTDWVQVLKDATAGRGVDVILDMVGGDYVARNLELLAIEGRLVQIAFLKTSKVELDLMQVMRRRLTITGSTLAPAVAGGEGADCPRARAKRVAAHRGRRRQADHLRGVPAGARGGGARADGIRRAHREDRVGHLKGRPSGRPSHRKRWLYWP